MLEGRLPELRRDLRRGVIHELSVSAEHVARVGSLLLLVWVSAIALVLMLRLRRAGRRRR